MIHPHTKLEFVNKDIGFGVFATEWIPAGTITWVQDKMDHTIKPDELSTYTDLEKHMLETYGYIDSRGEYVLCWDHGKYINHSCRPNVLSTGFGFDISIDEIHEDEQLLTDYACLNLESSFFCKCSSLHCRKTISSSNLQDLIKQWDKKIRSVFHLLNQQPQPLWDLIPNQEEIQFYMQNIDKIPSSAQNLTPENYNLGPYQSIR